MRRRGARGGGEGARVIVLPELAITAYTCEDLFWQDALLDAAARGLARLVRETAALDALLLAGVPLRVNGKLYNCAAVASRGRLLGLVPKRNIPTYSEFYEGRHFCAGPAEVEWLALGRLGLDVPVTAGGEGGDPSGESFDDEVPFGSRLLFACDELPGLVVGAEICEDLWVPDPPSTALAQAGATLVCNLSASNELVGKADYRRGLVGSTSARLVCAYMYASAGWGESTQDLVFGGHDLVCENGRVLAETKPLADAGLARVGEGHVAVGASAVIDVQLLAADRRRMSTFETLSSPDDHGFAVVPFSLGVSETSLAGVSSTRTPSCRPTARAAPSAARRSLPSRRTAWPSGLPTRTRAARSWASRAALTPRLPCSCARGRLTCWDLTARASSPSRCPALARPCARMTTPVP